MGDLKAKLSELKKSGKIDKFRIYIEIFEICFKQRDRDIFTYFDKFIKAWREYLEFDENPNDNLTNYFGKALNSILLFIKRTNYIDGFNKYFSIYEEFEHFIVDKVVKSTIFQSCGYVYWLKQDTELSLKFLKQSLELINETEDVLSIPNRYTNIGYIYEDSGDYETAEKYYLQGLDYANQNNYQKAMHMAFAALGRLKMARQEYHEAIKYFTETLNLMDSNAKDDNRLAAINNIACCYIGEKKPKKSLEYFNLMPLKWLKKNDPQFYYSILINMSINEISLGKYEAAEEKLQITAEFARKNKELLILQNCYTNFGSLFKKSNQFKKAISIYQKLINIAEENKNKQQLNNYYQYLADAYKKNRQPKQAIVYYKKSQKLCIEQHFTRKLIQILLSLSECYSSIDQPLKAYKTLKKFVETKDKYEEDLKKQENKKNKESTYEAGRSRQYKFSEGLSLISAEMSNKIGEQIIGNSTVMDKIIQEAFLTSRSSEASILLLGESGTGKDLIAKLIHFASVRHKGPFVAVNSAVFSAGLVQSALFGHRKGAFTGASYDHIGYFEEADNGTIFLDEISEMPSDIQANLLRILETKIVKRLGDSKNRKTDFRLVSASNKDIYSLIDQNKFRFDLFNRINTVEIRIPPLRDRKEDIPLLIEHFFNVISQRLQKQQPIISQDAINMLCDYNFPGNVRELKNIIERLILFCKNGKIGREDVFFLNSEQSKEIQSYKSENLELALNENRLIMEAMKRTDNVQVEAAKLLGISTYALNRRLKKMM